MRASEPPAAPGTVLRRTNSSLSAVSAGERQPEMRARQLSALRRRRRRRQRRRDERQRRRRALRAFPHFLGLFALGELDHLDPEFLEKLELDGADDDVAEAALLAMGGRGAAWRERRRRGVFERESSPVISGRHLGDLRDDGGELRLRDRGVLRARVREEHVADHVADEVVAYLRRTVQGEKGALRRGVGGDGEDTAGEVSEAVGSVPCLPRRS